jgi:branched-subunit amino acid transport protein
VLALDTFALFDIALYAIGFTPYAVLAALFFACLLQLISARSGHAQNTRHHRELAAIVLIATLVHLLLRLPTGNMWDALLDPWLWVIAHVVAVSRLRI